MRHGRLGTAAATAAAATTATATTAIATNFKVEIRCHLSWRYTFHAVRPDHALADSLQQLSFDALAEADLRLELENQGFFEQPRSLVQSNLGGNAPFVEEVSFAVITGTAAAVAVAVAVASIAKRARTAASLIAEETPFG